MDRNTNDLSPTGKVLVLLDFLSRDGIITFASQSVLKDLLFRNPSTLTSLLPLLHEESETTEGDFIDAIYAVIDVETERVFDDLFSNCSLEVAKSASKGERALKQLTREDRPSKVGGHLVQSKSLIYGEVEFKSFNQVLRKICHQMEPGKVFYDIGSGSGRAVFASRFTQDFSKCVGIELLESLHKMSNQVHAKYEKDFQQILSSKVNKTCEFYLDNLLDFDWSDGDVVFANSTCFDDSLMEAIGKKASSLKPGSFLVTFTKGIKSEHFEQIEKKRYKMSWGPATVFIHRRKNPDGTPSGPAVLTSGLSHSPEPAKFSKEDEERYDRIHEENKRKIELDKNKLTYGESSRGDDDDEGGDGDGDGGDDSESDSNDQETEDTESNYVITPNTSFSGSVEFYSSSNNSPERSNSRNSLNLDVDTNPGSPINPPQPPPRAPMSPNLQRTTKESREGILTSPKDTMLMQRKRMKGKKNAKPVSNSFFD